MQDAIDFIHALGVGIYTGLDTIPFPVLGVSIFTVLMAVTALNLTLLVISRLTGGRQDKDDKARLDNNNNYIYRR